MFLPILLSACADPPCEPTPLGDTPAAPAGELRHGLAVEIPDDVAPAADGLVCLSCGAVFHIDPTLHAQRRFDLALDPLDAAIRPVRRIAARDDATFVLDADLGKSSTPDDPTTRPPHFQLFALAPDGTQRWHLDLGRGKALMGFPEGILAGPGSLVVRSKLVALALAPDTGAMRWSTNLGIGGALVLDSAGGMLVDGSGFTDGPGTTHATLRHLDARGTEIWTASWAASESRPHHGAHIIVDGGAPAPDGGFVLVGEYSGRTLDLGDRTLNGTDANGNTFVVALGPAGATRWAAALGYHDHALAMQIAAATDDEAVLCGTYAGAGAGLGLPAIEPGDLDAFVARVNAGGAVTTHALGGPGSQSCYGILADGSGGAIVTVTNEAGPPHTDGAVMHVGSRMFHDAPGRLYVLDLVP